MKHYTKDNILQKLQGIFLRYIFTPALFLAGLALIVRFIILYQSDTSDFWLEASFLISSIAAIFAGISASIALQTLKTTQESLGLIRATSRPFLNIQLNLIKGMSLDRAIFELVIQNTGDLPADHVIMECIWFIHRDGHSEKCALELEKANPPIIFPSGETKATYLVKGSENVDKLTVPGSQVKVTARYINKPTKQDHSTQRTFRIAFASAAPSFNMAQAIAVPEEDYWD